VVWWWWLLAVVTPNDEGASRDANIDDGARVQAVAITIADAAPDESARLQAYLSSFVGRTASASLVPEVGARLQQLQRYQAPLCALEPQTRGLVLHCILRRTAVVRSILIETAPLFQGPVNRGLPLNILEQELRKRIFLRPGELIDDTEREGRTKVARQRKRVEEFLESMGYFGAKVDIRTQPVGMRNEVDVMVSIEGGSSVRVRKVAIKRSGPLSAQELMDRFSRLCGPLPGGDCFEKLEINRLMERLETELRALGHPEARVRVSPVLVNPRTGAGVVGDAPHILDSLFEECVLTRADIGAHAQRKLPLPVRCVDLVVDIDAGPNVVVRFHSDEPTISQAPPLPEGLVLWMRETLFEPLSRSLQLSTRADTSQAWDTQITDPILRRAVTLETSASADDTEVELSRQQVEEVLRRRGYSNAKVRAEVARYLNGDIAVDFWLTPGPVSSVGRVVFTGNTSFDEETLREDAALASTPRTLQEAGFVSMDVVEQDASRLRLFYEQHGFPEANIRGRAERSSDGRVDVTFVIEEGTRFVLSAVELVGGEATLTSKVLSAIAHCESGRGADGSLTPHEGVDCANTPLRPDELPIDAQRVANIYAAAGYPNVVVTSDVGFAPNGAVVRFVISVVARVDNALLKQDEPTAPDDPNQPITAAQAARALARAPAANPSDPNNKSDDDGDAKKDNNQKLRQLRLSQIFIEGNLNTDREALLREAQLYTDTIGQPLNPERLADGIARLRRTGLFSRVDVELLGVNDGDDDVHVRIVVEERPTATIDLSTSFSTLNLFALRLEARNRNFLGAMLDASTAIDMGLLIGRASAVRTQIRWPRIAGSNITLSYSPLTASFTDQPAGVIAASPRTPYGETVTTTWNRPDDRRRILLAGSSLGLDWLALGLHPLIDNRLTLGIGVEGRVDYVDPAGRPVAPASLAALQRLDGLLDVFAQKPSLNATITPRMTWSNIDNPFDPRSGAAIELFVRMAPLGVAPSGIIGGQARGFWSFGDRFTLAANARMRLGAVFANPVDICRGGNDATEDCRWALLQNDLLRLGGERSVRGVTEGSVGEEGQLYDVTLRPRYDDNNLPKRAVRPGTLGAVGNVEARYTLFRNVLLGDIKPAAFVDLAYSGDDISLRSTDVQGFINDTRYAVAVGVGMRYVLPIGPLAVDVAWSPNDKLASLDQRFKFYIYLGYLF
jgi:outer membrane protein assembly factor BamA